MPFQSNPNAGAFDPNLLGMLFAERDKRREAERQAMLDQAKMQQDAMKFAMEQAKAQREEERADRKHRLEILKGEADLFSSLGEKLAAGERSASIVPDSIRRQAQGNFLSGQAPGNAVLTQNLTGTEEGMRALNKLAGENPQEAIRQGQAATQAFGQAESISGNPTYDRLLSLLKDEYGIDQAGLRLSGQVEGVLDVADEEAALGKEIDKESRAEQRAIRAELRAEGYRIAAEDRARKAELLSSEAEDNALRAGKWTGEALDKKRGSEETRLSFAPDTSKTWDLVGRMDPKDPQDILQLIQIWQRRVDKGATVREGDIDLVRMVGGSGFSTLAADARAFFQGKERFPEGFGERLTRSLGTILETEDHMIAALADEFDDYAMQNGWSKPMKARAEAYRKHKEAARARIAARGTPSGSTQTQPNTSGGMSQEDFDRIANEISISTGIPIDDVPDRLVVNAWKYESGGVP